MSDERTDAAGEPLDDPIASTRTGRVRGTWRGSRACAAFLGIPFAAPPVGERRFGAPARPEPWDGVRDARAYGPTPQRGDTGPTVIPEPSIPGDETLSLNVFTPAPGDREASLPVLVYIHGGGFTLGSPASPWYDGAAFARDGVVTVTVAYRLGFDGFGCIPGAPSNRAVRDWIAALEWVQENIRAFGGDPGRVTIAGQSAGGGAVLTLLSLPAAQHLFHAAWSLSGALGAVTGERARTIAAKIAASGGVPVSREGFASLSEKRIRQLQGRSTGTPATGLRARLAARIADGMPWGPVVDGDLVPHTALDGIRAGVGADKPLVLGATDDEFSMTLDRWRAPLRAIPPALALAQLPLTPDARHAWLAANRDRRPRGTAAILGHLVTDVVFRSAVPRYAAARAGAPTWTYRFAWRSPADGWSGHCYDVPFWFDALAAPGVTAVLGDDPPRSLTAAYHGAAAAFVRDHDAGWRPWSDAPGATRVFGGDPSRPDVEPNGYAEVHALV